jgi:mannitol-specific phosphotransferase system IIBC component
MTYGGACHSLHWSLYLLHLMVLSATLFSYHITAKSTKKKKAASDDEEEEDDEEESESKKPKKASTAKKTKGKAASDDEEEDKESAGPAKKVTVLEAKQDGTIQDVADVC